MRVLIKTIKFRGAFVSRLIALFISCLFFQPLAMANGGASIKLETVHINVQDRASLMRGARFFATNCMVCHSMKYLEHNKLAEEAGITLDKMPLKEQEWWLGIKPPDLSLIVSKEGADWVYTYLHSFYKDPSRPTGSNNLLMPNSAMTNVLAPYQGQQELTDYGKQWLQQPHRFIFRKPPYYRLLKLVSAGSMTPEQYDETMTDLVNFLAYASEPKRIQREHMGIWVILFLVILAVFAWLLKKAYWKKPG